MTLTVALHNPTKMRVHEFASGGRLCARVSITDQYDNEMEVYTDPEIARAVAEAFAAAIAPEAEDYIATPEDFALEDDGA